MPRITVWLRDELYEFAKAHKINVSATLRETMMELAKQHGYTETELMMNVKGNRDKILIVRVRCPKCGAERNTTTIKNVKCFRCNAQYAVYPKNGMSRIVSIVKGTKDDLDRTYRLTFNGRR